MRIFFKGKMTQRLAVGDLLDGGGNALLVMCPPGPMLVYSDPPWNPGNEKWWRRHADVDPPVEYGDFLAAWCRAVSGCHPLHILCEQSSNLKQCGLLLDAVSRCPGWALPLLEQFTVYYGSPGSAGCRRMNVLLHFGTEPLTTGPSGMHGEAMTRRVFEGLRLPPNITVADPCLGKGMTSRMAHYFGLHCIGTELNPRRLDYAIHWLQRQGYEERTGE